MTTAWLLTVDGLIVPVPPLDGSLRGDIEAALGSDLLAYTPIVPGLSVWRDLLAAGYGLPINATALGLVDLLLDLPEHCLPRLHGDVVLASFTPEGEPAPIGRCGTAALVKVFGNI